MADSPVSGGVPQGRNRLDSFMESPFKQDKSPMHCRITIEECLKPEMLAYVTRGPEPCRPASIIHQIERLLFLLQLHTWDPDGYTISIAAENISLNWKPTLGYDGMY